MDRISTIRMNQFPDNTHRVPSLFTQVVRAAPHEQQLQIYLDFIKFSKSQIQVNQTILLLITEKQSEILIVMSQEDHM